jgi:hypothetical protein
MYVKKGKNVYFFLMGKNLEVEIEKKKFFRQHNFSMGNSSRVC